jgi:hypothetical protein
MVRRAMEEAYDENKFYDTPELRLFLKDNIVAKAILLGQEPPLN